MLLLKKTPFLNLWILASLTRILFLLIHYFRADPYGMPIVARIDRFLPFGIIVEIGALAVLIAFFALLSHRFKQSLFLAKLTTILYLVWGLLDLETYRFLKQHITFSFIKNYVKISSLNDSTLLLSLQSDPTGNILFSLLVLCLITSIILIIKKNHPQKPKPKAHWLEVIFLILLASTLGSSLHWLNPSLNRHNRLNPPLYIMANEIQNLLVSKYHQPTPLQVDSSLKLFIQRDSSKTHFLANYPFVHMPIEEYCHGKTTVECQLDFDKDGFRRNQDCNDFDSSINPKGIEVARDAIDQNCSGMDKDPMNIVFIVGESLNQQIFMNEFSDSTRLKNFKRMAHLGGKLFPNTYSNGFPSVYGAASIYLGILNHPHRSIFGEFTAKRFKGFPEYLSSKYYYKMIVSGADPYFDNQATWLNKYYEQVVYDKNNGLGNYNADEVVFQKAIHLLKARDSNKSFLLTLNNHTTHTPFKYPKDYKPNWQTPTRPERFAKALDYFDTQLGTLLDYLTDQNLLNNTVFLVIGDHGMAITPEDFKLPEFYGFEKSQTISGIFSANPQLFNSSEKKRFSIESSIVSQVDIAPTILDIAGIHTTHHFLGQSLLKETLDNRPALFYKNGAISLHSPQNTSYAHLDYPEALVQTGSLQNQHSSYQISSSKHLAHLIHFLIDENKIWNPRFQKNKE